MIYGKLGQGLGGKKVHDTRTDDYVPLRRCDITNPFLASFVTGMMRAILGETLNRLPDRCQVLMATTDGFLSNATEQEVMAATSGPLCEILKASRQRLLGNGQIIKLKAQARRLVISRRRSEGTISVPGEGVMPIITHAGITIQAQGKEEKNQWYVKEFFNRTWGTTFEHDHMPTLYEMYHSDLDLVPRTQTVKLSLDFDWCRKPSTIADVITSHGTHVSFDTVPWLNKEEFQEHQDQWLKWSKEGRCCMKEKSVVKRFMDRLSIKKTRGMNRKKNEDPVSWCFRVIIRAYVQRELGLDDRFQNHDLASMFMHTMLVIPNEVISRERKRQMLHLDEPVLDEKSGLYLAKDSGAHPLSKLTDQIENQKRMYPSKGNPSDPQPLAVPRNSVPRTQETEFLVDALTKVGIARGIQRQHLFA